MSESVALRSCEAKAGARRYHPQTMLFIYLFIYNIDTVQLRHFLLSSAFFAIESGGMLGHSQRSKDAIANGKHLSVIVNVMRMMDRMVFAAHDNFTQSTAKIKIHGIVNVRGPQGGKEQQSKVGWIMAGDK